MRSNLFKTLLFSIFVPGVVAGLFPVWLVHQVYPARHMLHSWHLIGFFFIAIGVSLYLDCAWDFAVTGLGTPAPVDAPKVLVVKGLYRFVRNPMYVGVLSTILGLVLLYSSHVLLIYLASVWLTVHLFIVFYEEPALRGKFGPSYDEYCRHVRRWLPRFPPAA